MSLIYDTISLLARAYVPLYDNEDGTQSRIGEPIVSLSPNEIYSSKVRVKAYAGPMSPDQVVHYSFLIILF